MMSLVKRYKLWLERRRAEKEQEKTKRLHLTLAQLREVLLAIDEVFAKENKLPREVRKRFWRDFFKSRFLRKEVFDVLVADGNLDTILMRYNNGKFSRSNA